MRLISYWWRGTQFISKVRAAANLMFLLLKTINKILTKLHIARLQMSIYYSLHHFIHIIFSGKHFKLHLQNFLKHRSSMFVGAELLCLNTKSFSDKSYKESRLLDIICIYLQLKMLVYYPQSQYAGNSDCTLKCVFFSQVCLKWFSTTFTFSFL